MKKLLLCFLCMLMLFAVGCSSENETATETVAETEFDGKVTLIEGGKPTFVICCSDIDFVDSAQYMQKILLSKTGISFSIVRSADDVDGNAIYIGTVDGEENSDRVHRESITYGGYGTVYKDGNIYVCGYTAENISIAVQTFLGNITPSYINKDAEGGTYAYCETSMMLISNPDYSVTDAKLLGADLYEYDMVVATGSGGIYNQMVSVADMFQKNIGNTTGVFIDVLRSEEDAAEHAICVDLNERLEIGKYRIQSDGAKLRVEVSGLLSMYAAFEDIESYLQTDTSDGISVNGDVREGFLANSCTEREDGTYIRVMSSNVLGTGLEEIGQCPTAMRAQIMSEYVLVFEPDSVGVQEYYGTYTTTFTGNLNSKYATVGFTGYGIPIVSTLYLKDKYTVVEQKCIEITNTGGPTNYLTWVALEDKTTGDIYIHGNLHLDYRADTFRLTQAATVNAELASVMEKYPQAVIAVTGDYNCKVGNSVLSTIKGSLAIEDAVLSAPAGKADNKHVSFHNLCEYASVIKSSAQALDHVFVGTATGTVLRHKIVHDELICHASDHYPVIVDIAKK